MQNSDFCPIFVNVGCHGNRKPYDPEIVIFITLYEEIIKKIGVLRFLNYMEVLDSYRE